MSSCTPITTYGRKTPGGGELLASIRVEADRPGAAQTEAAADSVTSASRTDGQTPSMTPALPVADQPAAAALTESVAGVKPKPAAAGNQPEALAILRIPAIDAKLPVLEGVTDSNMKAAAVHFTGTALPGKAGNTVIAAHNSYVYGRLFNRLNALKPGDTVVLQSGKSSFTYKVTGMEMVEPTEVSVLRQPRTGEQLTLITCNEDGSQRLVVHAARADE
ncbi:class D sortase [Paenibacillus sp. P26]|nr:class D sortase [Paenibacillus sp. P26]